MAKYPANKNGLPFGAFVRYGSFAARVAGASNGQRTFCDVWGVAHEMGDVYTSGLVLCDKATFVSLAWANGHDGPYDETYAAKLKAWDAENGVWND